MPKRHWYWLKFGSEVRINFSPNNDNFNKTIIADALPWVYVYTESTEVLHKIYFLTLRLWHLKKYININKNLNKKRVDQIQIILWLFCLVKTTLKVKKEEKNGLQLLNIHLWQHPAHCTLHTSPAHEQCKCTYPLTFHTTYWTLHTTHNMFILPVANFFLHTANIQNIVALKI